MRRRIILKCVVMLMLFCMFFSTSNPVLAAGEVAVQVKDVSASAGQTVTTELIMDGTFASFQGSLIYDTSALTLEKIEATSLISGSMTMFNQDDVTNEFVNGSFVSASANNMAVNGAVLTFTFSAGSNANGTYSFSIEQFLVYDEEGVPLTVNPVDTDVASATLYSETQASTTTPATNNSGDNTISPEASADPNNQDSGTNTSNSDDSTNNQGTSTDSNNPNESDNSPDASTDPNNPDTSTDPDNTGASTDTNETDDSTNSNNTDGGGNGLVVILLIIASVVVVGIVVIVVRVKRKNKSKDKE